MNRIFLAFASLSLLIPSLASADVSARLVKGPDSAAVYYTIDDRRFAFPNEAIFRSWYQDFSQVNSVSREALAQLRLAGNVAYQPGALVKLTTDPKVYAVDHLAKLHWIKTEAIAQALYGAQWAQLVHDLPDAFFAGYTIMEPIEAENQWNVSAAVQANSSIALNQELTVTAPTTPTTPLPPTPTSTPAAVIPKRLVIAVTPSPVHLGDAVTVRAFAVGSVAIQQISLTINGINVNCLATPCVYSYTVPTYNAPTQITIHGEARYMDQTSETVDGSVQILGQAQGALRLTGNMEEVKPGDAPEWIATWSDQTSLPARLSIFVDNDESKICFNTRECRYNQAELSPVGTTHSIYAKASENGGQEWITASSTYRVVANPHPTLTLTVDKETMYTGEITSINAEASDDMGIARLQFFVNDQLVKTCSSLNCSTPVGPWSTEGFVILKAVAEDRSGLTVEKAVRVLVLPAPPR